MAIIPQKLQNQVLQLTEQGRMWMSRYSPHINKHANKLWRFAALEEKWRASQNLIKDMSTAQGAQKKLHRFAITLSENPGMVAVFTFTTSLCIFIYLENLGLKKKAPTLDTEVKNLESQLTQCKADLRQSETTFIENISNALGESVSEAEKNLEAYKKTLKSKIESLKQEIEKKKKELENNLSGIKQLFRDFEIPYDENAGFQDLCKALNEKLRQLKENDAASQEELGRLAELIKERRAKILSILDPESSIEDPPEDLSELIKAIKTDREQLLTLLTELGFKHDKDATTTGPLKTLQKGMQDLNQELLKAQEASDQHQNDLNQCLKVANDKLRLGMEISAAVDSTTLSEKAQRFSHELDTYAEMEQEKQAQLLKELEKKTKAYNSLQEQFDKFQQENKKLVEAISTLKSYMCSHLSDLITGDINDERDPLQFIEKLSSFLTKFAADYKAKKAQLSGLLDKENGVDNLTTRLALKAEQNSKLVTCLNEVAEILKVSNPLKTPKKNGLAKPNSDNVAAEDPIVSAAKGVMSKLAQASEELQKALQSNAATNKKNKELQKLIHDYLKEKESFKQEILLLKNELEKANREKEQLNQLLLEKQRQIETQEEAHQEDIEKLKLEIQNLKKADAIRNQQMVEGSEAFSQLEEKLNVSQQEIHSLQQIHQGELEKIRLSQEDTLKRQEQALEELREQAVTTALDNQAAKYQVEKHQLSIRFEQQIQEKQKEIDDLNLSYARERETQLKEAEELRQMYEAQIIGLQTKNYELEQSLQTKSDELATTQSLLNAAKEGGKQLEQQYANANASLQATYQHWHSILSSQQESLSNEQISFDVSKTKFLKSAGEREQHLNAMKAKLNGFLEEKEKQAALKLDQELKSANEKYNRELQQKLDSIKSLNDRLAENSTLTDNLKIQVGNQNDEIKRLQEAQITNIGQIEVLKKQSTHFQELNQQLKASNDESQQKIRQIELTNSKQIKQLEEQIKQLEEQIEYKAWEVTGLRTALDKMEEEKAEEIERARLRAEQLASSTTTEKRDLSTKVENLQQSLNEFSQRFTESRSQFNLDIAKKDDTIKQLQLDLQDKEGELLDLKKEIDKYKQELSTHTASEEQLSTQISNLTINHEREHTTLEKKYQELQTSFQNTKASYDELSETTAFGKKQRLERLEQIKLNVNGNQGNLITFLSNHSDPSNSAVLLSTIQQHIGAINETHDLQDVFVPLQALQTCLLDGVSEAYKYRFEQITQSLVEIHSEILGKSTTEPITPSIAKEFHDMDQNNILQIQKAQNDLETLKIECQGFAANVSTLLGLEGSITLNNFDAMHHAINQKLIGLEESQNRQKQTISDLSNQLKDIAGVLGGDETETSFNPEKASSLKERLQYLVGEVNKLRKEQETHDEASSQLSQESNASSTSSLKRGHDGTAAVGSWNSISDSLLNLYKTIDLMRDGDQKAKQEIQDKALDYIKKAQKEIAKLLKEGESSRLSLDALPSSDILDVMHAQTPSVDQTTVVQTTNKKSRGHDEPAIVRSILKNPRTVEATQAVADRPQRNRRAPTHFEDGAYDATKKLHEDEEKRKRDAAAAKGKQGRGGRGEGRGDRKK